MKKGLIVLIAFLSICSAIELQGQDKKVDSLLQLYDNATQDTTSIRLLLDIGDVYKNKISDSALYYYNKALEHTEQVIISLSHSQVGRKNYRDSLLLLKTKSLQSIGIVHENDSNHEKAIKYYLNSLKISEELGYKKGMANCYNNIGIILKNQGNYDKAMGNYFKSLKIREELDDKNGMASCYNNIGIVHKNQGNYDKALEYYSNSLKIREELGDKSGIGSCYHNIGNVHADQGNYDKALGNYFKSLRIKEEIGDKKGMANCYINIGVILDNQGSYDRSMENYLLALQIHEKLGDKKGMATCYINIGQVHSGQGSYNKAIENYLMALNFFEELGYKRGMAFCTVNIGNIYRDQSNYNKAMETYLKSLKLFEELGNKRGISGTYGNIGIIYQAQGNYDKAIKNYLKIIKIFEELGDKENLAVSYILIGSIYMTLADSSHNPGAIGWNTHMNLASKYLHKAYNLALEIGTLPKQNDAAAHLQKAYTKLGNFKEALKYAEIFITTKDSMFSEEKTKALAEMTTKYEAEKKQLQIDKMEKQKELDDKTIEAQQAQNRKQQIMIFSAVVGFLIVLVFSMIILRMFRQKKRANILLASQNNEINQQKEKIEEQNQNITDSIVYAQRIQRALLPPGDYMKQLLPSRFILYKPRDIVSGDFYWVNKKDGIIITASADCTGHGVPGAMMSMLGVSILNEIVNTMKNLDAGEILNNLRTKIIDSLHQGGEYTNMYDGMDLALCLIDMEKNKVQFSGANCPLCLIRDGELIETKGDKMPIGVHAMMDPFTNHTLKLQEGDLLYTFSDGYIDQFGGEDEKRFTQRRFRKLLVDIHDKSMAEQKEELEKTLNNWQGKSDQIDDILVMGVRI